MPVAVLFGGRDAGVTNIHSAAVPEVNSVREKRNTFSNLTFGTNFGGVSKFLAPPQEAFHFQGTGTHRETAGWAKQSRGRAQETVASATPPGASRTSIAPSSRSSSWRESTSIRRVEVSVTGLRRESDSLCRRLLTFVQATSENDNSARRSAASVRSRQVAMRTFSWPPTRSGRGSVWASMISCALW